MTKTRINHRAMAAIALAVSSPLALAAAGHTVTLTAAPEGDAMYSWNSKYGPYGYSEGDATLGVSLQMGGQWGNDYTQGIIEIPIGALLGGALLGAELQVRTTGFDTGYWYGSAGLSWLDIGTNEVTGHVKADGLGAMLGAPAITWTLWKSGDAAYSGASSSMSFDVTSAVQADLAAGRRFSTFVLAGSRETWGGIYAAESGQGARLVAQTTAAVPEPATWASWLAGLGVLAGVAVRRRRS